jgi:hypothetical protein
MRDMNVESGSEQRKTGRMRIIGLFISSSLSCMSGMSDLAGCPRRKVSLPQHRSRMEITDAGLTTW